MSSLYKLLRDPSKIYKDIAETVATYIVFTDGSRYYAKNGSTGMIEYSDTDLGRLLNNVINALPKTSYTELNETVTNTPYGRIIIREGKYDVYTPIVIPPGSIISIEGAEPTAQSHAPISSYATALVYKGTSNVMINVSKGSYGYVHSKVRLAGLKLYWSRSDVSGTAVDWAGAFMGVLERLTVNGPGMSYPVTGIYLRSENASHITLLQDIDIGGFQYGLRVGQEHVDIYTISVTACQYGIRVDLRGSFKRGGIHGLQLFDNVVDFYAIGDGVPIFIDVMMLEHSGAPPGPVITTNGRKLIIGQLTFTPCTWNVITSAFDNINNVILLSDRATCHGGPTHLLVRNKGTATFSGDGTTTQFTIAHGLATAPSKIQVTPGSSDAKGDFYVTGDSTYIYVNYATAPPTGTNNVVLYWFAEV